jgi:hypothetical protein
MGDLSIRWEDSIKVDIKEDGFQDVGRLNSESYTNLLSLFSLLELTCWSTLLPFLDEEKLWQLSNLRTPQVPQTIKEIRKIFRCLAFSSAEAESAFSLMHNPVIYRRNAF